MIQAAVVLFAAAVSAAPASDTTNARWRAHDNAIRVWIDPEPSAPGWDHAYANAVRRSFVDWNRVGLPLRFRFTRDSAAADVRVSWTPRFDEPVSGRTRTTTFDARRIVQADVVLAVHHADGARVSPEEMRVLALHEIGHVLGLDHSPNSSSVMAPTVRVRGLSPSDRAIARSRYAADR